MAAISALRTTFGALRRNPVLFLAGLAYGVVVLPQSALSLARVPIAPALLQILTFFVTPFVLAGLIGMADEAVDGDTSLGALRSVGAAEYMPFLVGKFVELAINLAFGVLFVVAAVGVVLLVGAGPAAGAAGASTGGLAVAGVVLLALVLAFLAVQFLIQFFPVFIVAGDSDAVESFTDSARFVRANLAATLGYTLIQFLVGVVVAAPLTGFAFYQAFRNFDPSSVTAGGAGGAGTAGAAGAGGLGGMASAPSVFSTPEVIAISLIGVAATMVGMAFRQTYAVAFYRRHADADADAADDAEVTDETGADESDGVSRASDDAEWRYE